MESTEKSFEILHFSQRKWNSYHEQGCYRINLVFRASDTDDEYYSTKQRFLDESKEWKKSEIVQDLDLFQKYSDGLRMINKKSGKNLLEGPADDEEKDDDGLIPIDFVNDNGLEREDVYTKGYQENWNTMFQYNEKFDVFRFYEYFEINLATEGIIQYIKELQKMYNPDTYYAGQFFRALKSLEIFWD
jgi:hypothetical protein